MDDKKTTAAEKKAKLRACKRQSLGTSAADRKTAHKAKMAAKRDARPMVRAGFRPVANERINDAIEARKMIHQMGGMTAVEAHDEAIRDVARTLPARRRDFFRLARPTRNNDPSYRNGGSITGDGSRAAARAKAKKVRKPRAKKAAA